MNDRQRAIALFRYSLIREAADASLTKRERGELVRDLAGRDHAGPDGGGVRVARNTLDRWIRTYRAGGFEALAPAPRSCEPKTPAAMLALAEALKREVPGRTAAQVREIIRSAEGWARRSAPCSACSCAWASTPPVPRARPPVLPALRGRAPQRPVDGRRPARSRRRGRKTYLFAFIDDHSRALVGYRWGLSEDTVRLEAALRAALASGACPGDLRRQRQRLRVRPAAPGLRQPGHPPGALPARSAPGAGQDRALLRHRAGPVPGRGQARGVATWSSSTGCSRPGWRPSITAGSTPRRGRARCSAWRRPRCRCCPTPRPCTRRSCGPRSGR